MLTEQEVIERATTPEKALDVSIQHHEENLTLSEEEVREATKDCGVLKRSLCGLCTFHRFTGTSASPCDKCILGVGDTPCYNSESQYKHTNLALDNWLTGNGSFADYRIEQFKMVELLKGLRVEQKKLFAELEKPKLRHGDYGIDVSGHSSLVVRQDASGVLRAGGSSGFYEHITIESLTESKPDVILGNIFDDLKRNSEDLRSFTVQNCTDSLYAYIGTDVGGKNKGVQIDLSSNCLLYSLEDATKIHQKLGQMLATIRRDKAGGK